MRKRAFFTLCFLSFLFILPKPLYADGMIIKPDPYADRWDFSYEITQNAFITFNEGNQEMLISVGYEEDEGEGMVWLFPIPSEPNDISIDVLKDVPDVRGEEISLTAEKTVNELYIGVSLTQFYPILYAFQLAPALPYDSGLVPLSMGSDKIGTTTEKPDVVVYEHIEKEGITSEVITARTAEGLFDYMRERGLDLEVDSIPVLNNYIGKKYSFVVSWITAQQKSEESLKTEGFQQEGFGYQNEKGIFISFPTEDLYFPLLPTSVYGDKVIPVTIRVGDYVTPKIFSEIEAYTTVEYYLVDNKPNSLQGNETFNWVGDSTKYTKMEIKAPSNLFVDDLWIESKAPLKAEYTTFIINNNWVVGIYILLVSSLVSGLLIGYLVFKGLRKNPRKLVLLSLSNCFTLLGLILATIFTRTKDIQESPEASIILKELRNKGYIARRRAATVLIAIFTLPVLLSPLISFYSSIGVFSIIALMIFVVILLLCRVQREDKELFKALRQEGYSVFTFLPRDKNKILFPILYSPLFLAIAFLLVKLIISSVK